MKPTLSSWLTGHRLVLVLGGYFLAHTVARALGSDSFELDEAELILVGQSLQWGYSGQPPLYHWIQGAVFAALGPGLVGLALVKNSLLFLSYLLFWLTARRMLAGDERLAALVTLSWLFVPQVVWESQRDLSHSVAVLTAASATLYVATRLLESRTLGGYLAYGLVLGLGVLAKYNFIPFALALNGALLLSGRGRALILDRRILLTAVLVIAVTLPHLTWVAHDPATSLHAFGKLTPGEESGPLLALGRIALAGVAFLTPLWLIYLLLFPRVVAALRPRAPSGHRREAGVPLGAYLAIVTVLLVVGAGGGWLTDFKDRWMQPLLFVFPLYFFLHASPDTVTEAAARRFVALAAGVAVVVFLAMALRAPLGAWLEMPTRRNMPFDAVAAALRGAGFEGGLIVASRAWLAGNLLYRFPGSRATVPAFSLEDVCAGEDTAPDRPALLVWEVRGSPRMPEALGQAFSACRPSAVLAPALRYLSVDVPGRKEPVCLGVVLVGVVAERAGPGGGGDAPLLRESCDAARG